MADKKLGFIIAFITIGLMLPSWYWGFRPFLVVSFLLGFVWPLIVLENSQEEKARLSLLWIIEKYNNAILVLLGERIKNEKFHFIILLCPVWIFYLVLMILYFNPLGIFAHALGNTIFYFYYRRINLSS